MLNFNFNPELNSLGGVEESFLVFKDYEEGYKENIQSITFCNESNFEEFVNELSKSYKFVKKVFKSNNLQDVVHLVKLVSDDFKLYSSKAPDTDRFNCSLVAKSDDITLDIWNKYIDFVSKHNDRNIVINLKTMTYNNGDICCNYQTLDKIESRLNASADYYPYINTDELFKQFFESSENILLLSGESGLGKSKFATLGLKYLKEHPQYATDMNSLVYDNYIDVVYTKSIKLLSNEYFWTDLHNNPLVIIDDLDFMLTRRSAEELSESDVIKNSFLNNFLTFTDGVVKNKTKFIITTNQKIDDIDQALMRKGRLFDILELRRLKNDEALKIWKNSGLDEDLFKQKFKGNVLASDLGSTIQKCSNLSADGEKSYLNDQSISKIVKFKEKKLGL